MESAWKKEKTKTTEECWWFNQGSPLSIRHYADGERVSERHRLSGGRESERMRGKLKKNDCGNITRLQEKGKVRRGGQAEGN